MSTTSSRPTIRRRLLESYPDVLTEPVVNAIHALAPYDAERKRLMTLRQQRREHRATTKSRITFLSPMTTIDGTALSVEAAREGRFVGGIIPADLERQWIQGTGPAARPRAPLTVSLRNVAYALLSGADGWMFDGEDALGQVSTMALDGQRNLKLAIHGDARFLDVAQGVAAQMNGWAIGALGRPIVDDVAAQLRFTTKLFRPRGLHLDDRHVAGPNGEGFSASIVDSVLYLVNNQQRLRDQGASLVLYLPKIQTAGEAAFWDRLLAALEAHLNVPRDTIRTYVLVEQMEATFQLMEIRAALGPRFVGYNTGRWDYINSVVDAMAWDPTFLHPNIAAVTMTYGYMRHYEDRVQRAANTPDLQGRCVLWQGGMEPNIPVGTADSVRSGMARALAGAEREYQAGASGKWVAHWKMVHVIRPVWEQHGRANQMGRPAVPLTYTAADADGLCALEPAPRTIRGARALISVGLQYGNAFSQGFQAAALKPADDFGNDAVLYLMEDMATGEIRLAILWEWLHKRARVAADESEPAEAGDLFTADLFARLLDEEYQKLLRADTRDVHDDSKNTTLPISRLAAETYVLGEMKLPWYIDLLNVNLDVADLPTASARIARLVGTFRSDRVRITRNLDLDPALPPGVS